MTHSDTQPDKHLTQDEIDELAEKWRRKYDAERYMPPRLLPAFPAQPRRSRSATFRMLYVRGAIAIVCGAVYAWAMWAGYVFARSLGAF